RSVRRASTAGPCCARHSRSMSPAPARSEPSAPGARARLDGAGDLRVFWSVILPLSRSILTAVAIFVFISAWNNFLWPFIVTNSPELMTIPVGLGTVKNAYGVQYAQELASAVIGALPLLIVFMLFQRHIIRGFATSGMGGQ
ncbi:carbohydrate ABC transporter permease, partial [Kocuria oceani]